MPKILKAKVRVLIHDYKVSCFKLSHDPEPAEAISEETSELVNGVLKQEFRYHFHREVDAKRAEHLNLIHWYSCEALLPPILHKVVERIVMLEKREDLHMDLMEKLMDLMSDEGEGES